jgi:hypothetical protein
VDCKLLDKAAQRKDLATQQCYSYPPEVLSANFTGHSSGLPLTLAKDFQTVFCGHFSGALQPSGFPETLKRLPSGWLTISQRY